MSGKEGFKQHLAIFSYDLSKLDNVSKVKFVYLLKGRTEGKGIVNEFKGFFLAPGCFAVPIDKAHTAEYILKQWKISYKKHEVLMR